MQQLGGHPADGQVPLEQPGHGDVLGEDENGTVLGEHRADQLVEQVEGVCSAAERLFGTGHGFDPSSARRGFTLLVADYTVAVLGPALSAAAARRGSRG